MRVLARSLTVFLLVCSFPVAYGQDLRTGVALADGKFLAAGECLAWMNADGTVLRIKPLVEPILSMAANGEHLFALDNAGHDLIEMNLDGSVIARETLPVHGRLRALASDRGLLWAVTDAGEIIYGNPASGWTVMDFNAAYAGYYSRMDFRAVAAGGGSVMVAGLRPDGSPAAYTSARGSVWSERMLDYSEEGQIRVFSSVPVNLSYDAGEDRFYLLGSGGVQLALPGCSHCNSLTGYPTDTLFARIPAVSGTLLLGSDGFERMETR